jgi:hypothetical protein
VADAAADVVLATRHVRKCDLKKNRSVETVWWMVGMPTPLAVR